MKLNSMRIYEIIQDRISIESIRLKHRIQLHIAVLIKRGKILEIATNAVGSRSKGAGFDTRSIHAERAVIRKLGDLNKLDGAILAVIRITKGTKQVVNSEPCHSCKCHLEKCIRDYGLKTVYYSS